MNSQWRRIIILDRRLCAGRHIVAREFAREMGVDERTIRRDLKEMQFGEYHLPLAYDRRERPALQKIRSSTAAASGYDSQRAGSLCPSAVAAIG